MTDSDATVESGDTPAAMYMEAADNIATKLEDLLSTRALDLLGTLAARGVLTDFNEHVHNVLAALAVGEDLPGPR